KLIANQGPVTVQAQNDTLQLMARHGLEITSTEDEISIVAKKKITLNAGGSYITLEAGGIESGTPGYYTVRSAVFDYLKGAASMTATHPDYPQSQSRQPLRLRMPQAPNAGGQGWKGMPYTLYADGMPLQQGVLDDSGQLLIDHQVITRGYRLVMSNGVSYNLVVPTEYRDVDQAQLANRGLQNHPSKTDPEVSQPASHKQHRSSYASLLDSPASKEDQTP
ncbi:MULTISPECIES: DUF2345 domain-containing protein, partial [Pseudomonas]|uniref:DUF2345 domain-containing protein n=1 Tax=Pseudomonas TaxID=286 RepID=UPI001BE79537